MDLNRTTVETAKAAADECIKLGGEIAAILVEAWPIPVRLFADLAVAVTLPILSKQLRAAYYRVEMSPQLRTLFAKAAVRAGSGPVRFAQLPLYEGGFAAVQGVASAVLDLVAPAAFDGSGGPDDVRARWAAVAERYQVKGWEASEIESLRALVEREYAIAVDLAGERVPNGERADGADVRADDSATNRKIFIPSNPKVLRLAAELQKPDPEGRSKYERTLEFTGGKEREAQTLLRQVRHYLKRQKEGD